MTSVATIGHGSLAADRFAALCRRAGIAHVVDVRRFPGSRRHPHFGRDAMAAWLPEAGIAYSWDERLGGRRVPRPDTPNVALTDAAFRGYADHMATPEFARALADLVATADGAPSAVMCAEALWWRCHRRLVADALVALAGTGVDHVFPDGRLTPHVLTAAARVDDGTLVYDVGTTPPMV